MTISNSLRERALAWAAGRVPTPDVPPPPAPVPQGVEGDALALAAKLVRVSEGLYLHPYLCPAGVPTIGWGATYYQDGRAVTLADPLITGVQATELLWWMLRTVYAPAVSRLCPGATTPGQKAALIDFAFNLGVGRLRASTLRKKVNAGQWGAVPAELRKWVLANGRVQRGLAIRREAEINLL